MHIVAQQTKILSVLQRPYFLSELIEAQDENNHAAVCEVRRRRRHFVERSLVDVDDDAPLLLRLSPASATAPSPASSASLQRWT